MINYFGLFEIECFFSKQSFGVKIGKVFGKLGWLVILEDEVGIIRVLFINNFIIYSFIELVFCEYLCERKFCIR